MFQRRQDDSVDFYRGWKDYKAGFGQVSGEFWLGNDKIHRLTASRPGSLRVEREDWNGVRVYAKYSKFIIGDEYAKYINLNWVHIQEQQKIHLDIIITWLLVQTIEILTYIALTTAQLDIPVPGGTNIASSPI